MKKPSGVVTFLFTDIEGSTRLSQEFPETLPKALKIHHSILKEAMESNNGFVFDITGDAIFCAFEKAEEAVKAAVVAQTSLSNVNWNGPVVNVRIGIHSGNAEWCDNNYLGYITLARAARVMSAAYGGQILISNDAYKLAKDKTRKEILFRDLGERRLKDVIQPIRLYQVVSNDLRKVFPPLQTLDARPNNLPVQLTSFIGRESEIIKVKDLLDRTRLLTFTGPGGAGKSRLSLQVAADIIDDFENGVWFVELSSLFEPTLLPQAIMNVLGLKEEPKKNIEDIVCDYLKDKEMLIIFDNCEHLIEPCAKLTEKLLSNCPKLKILATSREALRCSGEQTHRISSLDTPDPKEIIPPEKLSGYEAVRLFIERALAVDSSFRVNNDNAHALAEICYQLEGIPLAIELAAARIKSLSVEKINQRLSNKFTLLTGGKRTALPRQQTLRALIDWSYDLLTEEEKILWGRVSVFTGGWTLEAAEEICIDEKLKKEDMLELLNQLNEKSIIIFESDKGRYRILETLKQYGEEKLKEADDTETVKLKHLHHFIKLSESAVSELNSSEQQTWLEKLETDHSNIQSAIEWSATGEHVEEGARIAGALGIFWDIRGHYCAGKRLVKIILKNSGGVSKPTLGKLLSCAGSMTLFLGENEQAKNFYEEGLQLQRAGGDKKDISIALNGLGNAETYLGNYDQAKKIFEENFSIGIESGNKRILAVSLNSLGNIEYMQGNYEPAKKFYEESLAWRRQLGDNHGIAATLLNLGNIAMDQGNFELAQTVLEESLSLSSEIKDARLIATAHNGLGNIEFFKGNYDLAKKIIEESLKVNREIGEKRAITRSLNNLGIIEYILGNYEQAKKLHEESLALTRSIGEKSGIAETLNNLGNLAYNLENYEMAENHYRESLALRLELGEKSGIIECLVGFAAIQISKNNLPNAVMLIGVVETSLKSIGRVLELNIQKFLEQILDRVNKNLRPEELSGYLEEGKKLTLEQAVEMALGNG